ncbi:MAG TPA: hypothetical protein PKO33_12030, partial [Pyrinomonadaceae bacterium]|nr:hypothetical protein [Pyrinomonadaceae bacterium]
MSDISGPGRHGYVGAAIVVYSATAPGSFAGQRFTFSYKKCGKRKGMHMNQTRVVGFSPENRENRRAMRVASGLQVLNPASFPEMPPRKERGEMMKAVRRFVLMAAMMVVGTFAVSAQRQDNDNKQRPPKPD